MMTIKVIDSKSLYEQYLERVELLLRSKNSEDKEVNEEIELLTLLIEKYEIDNFKIKNPDPIDAVFFRMRERNLKQTDLIQYIGSKSRVSEILSRKRPLTIQMIRDLSTGLSIPVDLLISEPRKNTINSNEIDWSNFPIKEVAKKGWLEKISGNKKEELISAFEKFFHESGIDYKNAAFKKRFYGDACTPTSNYSLFAWLARVNSIAQKQKNGLAVFEKSRINEEFIEDVCHLSFLENGPLIAVDYLKKHGILVIYEEHLKGTYLDGAAFKDKSGTPIIGITLRHDRLDNFWFTLIHELVHITKHIQSDEAFLDDFDVNSEDEKEAEANRIARDKFIPRVIWKRSDAFKNPTKENILNLSRQLRISPSVIAGRIRKEHGNYTIHNDLVGYGQVRKLFSSFKE